MLQTIFNILLALAAVVAILDFFGVKPQKSASGVSMPLGRKWKLGIMLALVAMSLAMSGYDLYRSSDRVTIPSQQEWDTATSNVKLIQSRTFTNQEVELDGNAFENCTFVNVTFVWKGTKPFTLANNSITADGPFRIAVPKGLLGTSAVLVSEFMNDLYKKGTEEKCSIAGRVLVEFR